MESAIKKLKLGKAAGGDGIGPELLKLAPGPAAHALHKLFVTVWTSGKVPDAWKEGVIVSLYEGKGSAMFAATTDQFRYFSSLAKSLHMCYWDG